MFRFAMGLACVLFLSSCATTLEVSPAVRSDLAPTGKLRVGINYGNPLFATRDRATGELSGIAIDLARELGRRTAIPVELIGYESAGELTAGLKAGGWDLAFLAYEQAREAEITFAAAFAESDSTYLVPAVSKLRIAEDVDREGVRVAVSAGGGNDLFLTRTLKRAHLVRVPGGTAAAFKAFVADKLDAFAGLRPELERRSTDLPGSRVLDGRYTVIQYSAGVPKGRIAGAEYLRQFLEDVKASGLVAQMIDKRGVRGLTVPLPPPTVQIGGSM
jgi:polar amino acid transport system substrate-binding protein